MIIKNWFSKRLAEVLEAMSHPDFSHLEYDEVDFYETEGNVVVLGTAGVEEHDDSQFSKYQVSLIYQNTGLIAKGANQKESNYLKQIPGTIVVLNVHKKHHCIPDSRFISNENELWNAYCLEYERKSDIPSKQAIELKLLKWLIED